MGEHSPETAAPKPMHVDDEWARRIGISNFANAYAELDDLVSLGNSVRSILLIGVGQGLEPAILRWRGYEVTTFDIDERLRPDALGSVHDLSRYSDAQFDVAIASHVLEHLPLRLLDSALAELARVSRYALIYLPVNGPHVEVKIRSNFRDINLSLIGTLKKFFSRPDAEHAKYMDGHHYWEIGVKGFGLRDLRRRFAPSFDIIREYRNREWLVSYNFVLRSRRHAGAAK